MERRGNLSEQSYSAKGLKASSWDQNLGFVRQFTRPVDLGAIAIERPYNSPR